MLCFSCVMFPARISLLLVLQFYVIYLFLCLFIYFTLFFFFFFFTDSSELHWFIHSRGFAVQFESNHVLSTKKTLQITVKVFFYLPNILYQNEPRTGSISRYILYICCLSFFLGHNELQAESNTDKALGVIPVLNATSINISLLNAINLFWVRHQYIVLPIRCHFSIFRLSFGSFK